MKEIEIGGKDNVDREERYYYCYKCPNCGEDEIVRDFNYCPNCGNKFKWIDEA